MINVIWCFMIVVSIVFAFANGTVGETLGAVAEGAKSAVSLTILMAGTMAFWLGLTKIAEETGVTGWISRRLRPLLKWLFPEYKKDDAVLGKVSMNMTANILGLGNAATPLGLSAMDSMKGNGGTSPTASMILFVIINTASIQIIPTSIAALRSAYGSAAPFSVMPHVWISSFGSLIVCIMLCKLLEGMDKRKLVRRG